MGCVPDLYISQSSSINAKFSWISVLCGLIHCIMFISADGGTHWGTNNTYTNTTAGPLKLTDFCPGVEYLIHQNNTNTTFLQVNATDCEDSGLKPTAHQGVVYGVCEDLTTFCILHIQAPQGMRLLAFVQRLAYWCEYRHWTSRINRGYSRQKDVILKCNQHSLEEMVVGLDGSALVSVENINSPKISIVIQIIKFYSFVVNYTEKYSGYILTPYVNKFVQDFNVEWKVLPRKVIMISVQQLNNIDYCHLLSLPKYYPSRIMKLTVSKPNDTHQRFYTLNLVCSSTANAVYTSYLKIEFSKGYRNSEHRFLKIYVSTLSTNNQSVKLPSGLFNCSVNDYSEFQKHLDCNLETQCEDGRDETEHCAFSSPHCQGLVASHNKCFQLIYLQTWTPPTLSQHECHRIDGRLASIKTRKEQEDFLNIYKRYFKFTVHVGGNSGWDSVPFVYSMFRKWSDNTLIYNLNHFTESWQYIPSRIVRFMELKSIVFSTITYFVQSVMCAVKFQSEGVVSSPTSLAHLRSTNSTLSCTQQAFFVCQDSRFTHQFWSCDSNCIEAPHLQYCAFMNVSNAQRTYTFVHERNLQHSDAMFTCNDDTTTIHHTLLCDFRQDCPDGTDESFCEHPSCSGFLCSNGQCVPSSQRFNQYSDCMDDSDEVENNGDSSYLEWFKDDDRQQWVYVNLDGTGYFTRHVMSADQLCPDSHYPCQAESLYCLPIYTRCNGFADCVHGEDEQDCETVTCPGFYRCRSSTVCVHGDHLCDGWGQCPQRDDELMCDFTCPEGCLCQGHAFLCNEPFPSDLYPQLRYLDATDSNMSLADFDRNTYLVHLKLSQCSMYNISYSQLLNLKHVDLANNRLRTINLTIFLQLVHLTTLHLQNNPLSNITSEERNYIHYELRRLDISKTYINILDSNVSLYLPRGIFLNVSLCAINVVGLKGLKNIPQLKELDMKGNSLISFPLGLFRRSDKIERIFTSNYRLCCDHLFPKHSRKTTNCFTPDFVLPSCTMLLPSELHRVFFWVFGIVAIIGNSLCFVTSSAVTKVFGTDFVKLIAHLQISNICMGSHVSIVVLANYVFYGTYIQFEKAWTDSVICKLAGFLSFLASLVSMLIILFITLYHIIVFYFPGQSWRFSKHFTSTVCAVMWGVGFLLAAVPFLPGLSHWGLEGQSGLCRLALFDGHPSGPRFRWFTVTVVINGIWSVVTIAGQAAIYRQTPKYKIALSSTQRSAFSSVHAMRKLAVTDAACWIVFVLATMIRSYGVAVFDQIHGTMVVFNLPLNSALNPLLYLWTAKAQQRLLQQEEKLIEVLKLRLSQAGKQSRNTLKST